MITRSIALPFWQDRPPQEAGAIARLADQLGYQEAWIGEMATYDAFSLATSIGVETGLTLTVGPLAVGVRSPATMAIGVASVSDLSGRPARLALGSSSPVVVERWHGRPWTNTAAQMEEAADILRTLLGGERTAHEGRQLSSHGYRLRLDPPGCHLTVAAFGDRALQVAACKADRVVLNMVAPDSVERMAARLDELTGTRPIPPIAVWLTASVDPTEADHEQMARGRVGYLMAPGYREMLIEAGFGSVVELAATGAHPAQIAKQIPSEIDYVVGLAGSVTQIEDRLRAYQAAGVEEVCLVPATASDPLGARTLTALAPG